MRAAHQALSALGTPGEAPSATYVSAIVGGDAVTVCWLGDSRAYWLAPTATPTRLSTDDSMAEEMVAQGRLNEADALASPQAHVITRWLGADLTEVHPHVLRVRAGLVPACCCSARTGCGTTSPRRPSWPQLALPPRSPTRWARPQTLVSSRSTPAEWTT